MKRYMKGRNAKNSSAQGSYEVKQLGTNRTKYDIRQPLGLAVPVLRQVHHTLNGKISGTMNSHQMFNSGLRNQAAVNKDIPSHELYHSMDENNTVDHSMITNQHDTDFTVEQHSSRGRIGQANPL